MAQFYACVYYDSETDDFTLETWEEGTGRDDGDLYDTEINEWRWAEGSEEVDLETKMWEALGKAVASIPRLKPTAEPDVVY